MFCKIEIEKFLKPRTMEKWGSLENGMLTHSLQFNVDDLRRGLHPFLTIFSPEMGRVEQIKWSREIVKMFKDDTMYRVSKIDQSNSSGYAWSRLRFTYTRKATKQELTNRRQRELDEYGKSEITI